MTTSRALVIPLLAALLLPACVTTSTTSTTWGSPHAEEPGWARYGRVEQIREHVTRYRGDPGGGAVAGAIIGGLLGHDGGAGALVGAGIGAMVGAAASQGQGERRTYDVLVRYEDGAAEWYRYEDGVPFRVGDPVTLTPRGLVRG